MPIKGETGRDEAIKQAVTATLADSTIHTPDLKGRPTTQAMTDAIIGALDCPAA
jgi:isocitrate/isopropylmalate dehydrogenase